jgi:hypothetical protein
MIQDKRQIQINAPSHVVFDLIERMPNKFPVYKLLEAKPFFFIRILLVDGLHSAWEATRSQRPDDVLKLNIGDTMGPFTLTGIERPMKYCFSLKSLFFNCQTGYFLYSKDGVTELSFDLIAENPTYKEKIWWFVFKPFHGLFANKVLNVIKEKAEHNHGG